MKEIKKITTSKSFADAVSKAVEEMVRRKSDKEYLEKPYNGFYISTQKNNSENIFRIIQPKELGFEHDKIYVICESFFG